MISLLKAANKYIKSNEVKGIKFPTRPDCIDEEILGFAQRVRSYKY